MSYTIYDDELEVEFELDFEPVCNEITIRRVGDKIVVGCLAYDNCPADPMKEFDGMGELDTVPRTACRHFALNDFASGWRTPMERDFEANGIVDEMAVLIAEEIRNTPELIPWGVRLRLDLGKDAYRNIAEELLGWNPDVEWDEEDGDYLAMFDGGVLAEKAWDRLYEAGRIGSYLAVPVRFNDYGSSGVRIHTCALDEANAAWVPDKTCIENMALKKGMSHAEKMRIARKYADDVLEEYEQYCNGDVYGVVFEVFGLDGKKIRTDDCWGYYGYENARQSLKEDLESMIQFMERENRRHVGSADGLVSEMRLAA